MKVTQWDLKWSSKLKLLCVTRFLALLPPSGAIKKEEAHILLYPLGSIKDCPSIDLDPLNFRQKTQQNHVQ